MNKICGADVALIILKEGRYYTYRSIDDEAWPPPMDEIVSTNYLKYNSDTDAE